MRPTQVVGAANFLFRRPPRRAVLASFTAVSLGVVIGGTAAFWVFPAQAQASPGQNCFPFTEPLVTKHYTTVAEAVNPHHGTEVITPGMLVYNEPPQCVHIESIVSEGSDKDFAEVGTEAVASGVQVSVPSGTCSFVGDGKFHVIRMTNRNESEDCTVFQAVTPDFFYSFAVDDQNGDDKWTTWFNGSQLGGNPVNNTFSLSTSYTNGERFTPAIPPPSESADAEFYGLRYMPLNGSWTPWGQAECAPSSISTDPNYNNQLTSATRIFVSTGSSQC